MYKILFFSLILNLSSLNAESFGHFNMPDLVSHPSWSVSLDSSGAIDRILCTKVSLEKGGFIEFLYALEAKNGVFMDFKIGEILECSKSHFENLDVTHKELPGNQDNRYLQLVGSKDGKAVKYQLYKITLMPDGSSIIIAYVIPNLGDLDQLLPQFLEVIDSVSYTP